MHQPYTTHDNPGHLGKLQVTWLLSSGLGHLRHIGHNVYMFTDYYAVDSIIPPIWTDSLRSELEIHSFVVRYRSTSSWSVWLHWIKGFGQDTNPLKCTVSFLITKRMASSYCLHFDWCLAVGAPFYIKIVNQIPHCPQWMLPTRRSIYKLFALECS